MVRSERSISLVSNEIDNSADPATNSSASIADIWASNENVSSERGDEVHRNVVSF